MWGEKWSLKRIVQCALNVREIILNYFDKRIMKPKLCQKKGL